MTRAAKQRLAFVLVILASLTSFLLFFVAWEIHFLALGLGLTLAALAQHGAREQHDIIEECKVALAQIQGGNYGNRLYLPQAEDTLLLAQSINEMAVAVEERWQKLQLRVQEQDAVLKSMTEGVIALGPQGRILRANDAAARLLGFIPEEAIDRRIQEVVRHAGFLQFVSSAQYSKEKVEDDIHLQLGGERTLHAYGVPMLDSTGRSFGLLLVFSDVTRLKHLENVRREFVANVSHELRTPITSIKGFVETLCEGAIDNPVDARRFLEIIGRQADRLNAIFEDLLTLSRVEEGDRQRTIQKAPGKLEDVVRAAIESCALKAKQREIDLVADISGSYLAMFNASLLEQAVSNLLQNAIAYSESGTKVVVGLESDPSEFRVFVRDQGVGIEAHQLPRIFERFYRVEKSRTRASGGTGLGLSIVKHVAESHGGRASVVSQVGAGSTFTIHLPGLSSIN